MNLISLVVVVLRLMALNFSLISMVNLLNQLSAWRAQDTIPGYYDPKLWLLAAGLLGCAAMIWIGALPIARLVTHGVPRDISFGSVSLVDCYSIAFMGVGLIYISSHLPEVLNWAFYIFKTSAAGTRDSWSEKFVGYDMTRAMLTFIMGLVLFCKGRTWAVALARKHGEAIPPSPPAKAGH